MSKMIWLTKFIIKMACQPKLIVLFTDNFVLFQRNLKSKNVSLSLLSFPSHPIEDVSLSHIFRNMNGRAYVLAKEARRRWYIFFLIDQIRIDGDTLRRIDSSTTTWSSLNEQSNKKKIKKIEGFHPINQIECIWKL